MYLKNRVVVRSSVLVFNEGGGVSFVLVFWLEGVFVLECALMPQTSEFLAPTLLLPCLFKKKTSSETLVLKKAPRRGRAKKTLRAKRNRRGRSCEWCFFECQGSMGRIHPVTRILYLILEMIFGSQLKSLRVFRKKMKRKGHETIDDKFLFHKRRFGSS